MKNFKDLGIQSSTKRFTGDKIRIFKILDQEIIVYDYKIEDSKYGKTNNAQYLSLQISLNDVKYVVFTGSMILMDLIKKIPTNEFPFMTTIVKQHERYEFT